MSEIWHCRTALWGYMHHVFVVVVICPLYIVELCHYNLLYISIIFFTVSAAIVAMSAVIVASPLHADYIEIYNLQPSIGTTNTVGAQR